MQTLSRRNLFGLAAATPFLGATTAAASSIPVATRTVEEVQADARKRVQQQHLPNLALVSHEGKRVLFYDDLIKDKVVTINFFYAKCDEICPMVTANLAKVQKLLGDEVGRKIHMYSITLKPEEDDVSVVRDYREKFHARPGWTFFTGQPGAVEAIRKGIGFTYPEPAIDRDKTQHIGNVRYGNEPLMLWAACPGMAHSKWIAESFNWMVRPDTNRVQKP